MELSYRNHTEIDKNKWDACVLQSDGAPMYVQAEYLDIVSPDWGALIAEENNAYEIILPLTTIRKFGYNILKTPSFAQQLGIVTSEKLTKDQFETIIQQLKERFNYIPGYAFNVSSNLLVGSLPSSDFIMKYNMTVSLNRPYEETAKNYSSGIRNKLNKAKKYNLKVVESTDIDLLTKLFQEHIAPKILNVQDYHYQTIKKIYNWAKKENTAFLLSATDESGKVYAQSLYIQFKNRITVLFGASTPEGKQKGAYALIRDFVIRKFAGKLSHVDYMWGGSKGMHTFNKEFGAEKIPYYVLKSDKLPLPLSVARKAKAATVKRYRKLTGKPPGS